VSDLQPIAARVHQLADAARQRHRPDPSLPPVDLDELAALRREAHEADQRARWLASVPRRFITAHLRDLDTDIQADVRCWAETDAVEGRNLVLFGPVGTGKTHTAIAAVRALFERSAYGALFLPVVELLDQLRPGGPDGALERAAAANVLILDDLGAEKPSDWTGERLYSIVNRRWLEQRPTVATSNIPPDELAERVGERTYSRLVGCDAVTLKLAGEDRRRG
jgi:DNA replication protein DnaC